MHNLSRSSRHLTIIDVAERLQVSTRTVRRWIDQGELRIHRLGRQLRVTEDDLALFLNQRCRSPP